MFRSEELNKAIGGASSSQHCKGMAMDLDDVYGHKTNAEMYEWICNTVISIKLYGNLVMTKIQHGYMLVI